MTSLARHIVSFAASLRLTIACLGLAMVLVLAGTFAQVNHGVYAAQELYFRSLFVWQDVAGWRFPILPGGYLLGGLLVLNLLVAHITRFRWTFAKLGIHIIHAGLLLLILGQFASDFLSVESQLALDTGQTKNWSESTRSAELVFTDSSDPKTNTVVCIDQRALTPGRSIGNPALPFRVTVTDWMPNAVLRARASDKDTDRGAARVFDLVSAPRVTRIDRRDLPAVALDLADADGKPLGHWLASMQLDEPQPIPGTSWAITMRPRHYPLPFSLTLDKFIHESHPGTDIPSRFASEFSLRDTSGDSRPVIIQMNEPLRSAGRTIYQGAFANNDRTSILQVVQNPGWITPYVACSLVILGLLVQFGHHLLRAVRTRPSLRQRVETPGLLALLLPLFVLAVVVGLLVSAWIRHTAPAGRLAAVPVQANGRIQPLDTLARESLTLISGKSSAQLSDGTRLNSLDWLLTLVADPVAADAIPTFRVTHPDVLTLTGQPQGKTTRLSFDQLRPSLDKIRTHATSAAELPEKDPYRRAILQLDNALHTYAALRLSFRAVTGAPSLTEELAVYGPLLPHALDNAEAWQAGRDYDQEALSQFAILGRSYREADRVAFARPVWPESGITTDWSSLPGALLASATARRLAATPGLYAAVFENHDSPAAIDALVAAADSAIPAAASHARSESLFHALNLFAISQGLYLAAFLLAAVSWLAAPRTLRTIAWRVLLLAFLLTTTGLVWRIVLLGRPPVTNLYSSALFVAWVSVGLGLLAERFTRDGLVTAASAALGFASLLIAHHLAGDGDTMGVLIAVLDSNYWLATHVVAITIGYASTFLAGFLGIAFLFLRAISPRFDGAADKRLAGMIYGVVCFALLFSFVGTILGGIWADQSWGRFWGWDPKENGALLIVLWNALILHARWGGLVRARGLAVLAVAGNIVTAFSWFGTNLLGIGLHSYGFTETGFLWLTAFAATQILFALLALTPSRSASR